MLSKTPPATCITKIFSRVQEEEEEAMDYLKKKKRWITEQQ
jgi:hypothetical protein